MIRRPPRSTQRRSSAASDVYKRQERYIERAVGRMIDVNYHLLTEFGQAPPPDYYQSFVQLATLGVYPAEFAARIASCAGLRNRIAHEYDAVSYTHLRAHETR